MNGGLGNREVSETGSLPIVEVCLQAECRCRGSERIRDNIRSALGDTVIMKSSERCFRLCKCGPNIAVDGAVLSGIRPGTAVDRIRAEIRRPSVKREGVGMRPIDDLDAVLDGFASGT